MDISHRLSPRSAAAGMPAAVRTLSRGSRRHTLAAAALAGALTLFGLAGCGGSDGTASSATPTPSASSATTAGALTVKDSWVKAGPAGEMTAAFAVLVNNSAVDVTVTGAESAASPMELHELTMKDGKMVMQPKQGGFVIKAGGSHELAPGGDHLMLMKPAKAISPGDEVAVTLKLADGSTVAFTAIAKPFAGGSESYAPSGMPTAPVGSSTP